MICPDLDELEQYASNEMDAGSSAQIRRHVEGCPACRICVSDVIENLRIVGPVRQALGHAGTAAGRASDLEPPTMIGPYRVIRELGRGGMGVVYEAEQAEPNRRVALKVLHPGMDTDGRSERMFRREVQTLGRLRHVGIATIHEAGRASDGRPYFAMELVSGASLTEHARRAELPLTQRLELFRRVCDAVAYAHQRGVIHRDLKPSNILVDVTGQPKVLDYGLAKALAPDDAIPALTGNDETARIQGTLPYMSPEQVRGVPAEIDVRSDVYSLGVVLYELLCGQLPYRVNRLQLAEAARTICEDAPVRPSALSPAVRGDLETVLMKALGKSPDERYSSVAALGEDVERVLQNLPVLACAPTLGYQLRKLVSRHPIPSALVAALVLLTLGSAVITGILYSQASRHLERARHAEAHAEQEAQRALREAETATMVRDYLVNVFHLSSPDAARGDTVTARQLLDHAASRIESDLTRAPEMRATLMFTIGRVYANLGLYARAVKLLEDALTLRQSIDPAARETATISAELAQALLKVGDLARAEQMSREALRILGLRGGVDMLHTSMVLGTLADIEQLRGNLPGAEAAMYEQVELLRRTPNGEVGLPRALNSLGGMLAERGAFAEAIPLLEESLAVLARVEPNNHLTRLKLRGNLAWLLANCGRNDEADAMIAEVLPERRRILPPQHPTLATSLVTAGLIALNRGKPEDAEPMLREALTIREAAFGAASEPACEARGFLAQCLLDQHKLGEAQAALLDSHRLLASTTGSMGRMRTECLQRLIRLSELSGDSEAASHWRSRLDDE
ncbi:MAG: protein kinase [Planctomycetia bacterium]|nr:MAG: protein kinase [Planctomycetia bacterium]